jgi:hypothetical protein
MSTHLEPPRNPYFQFLSHRKEPFGEQVFYWLQWVTAGRLARIQVIVDYASAKKITGFFLAAAMVEKDPPPPVRLPHLELECRKDDLTVRASDGSGAQALTFDRRLAAGMSCALATSGLSMPRVGGDPAAFPELASHPLVHDLVSRSALQEMRDHPAFDVLQANPVLREMAAALLPA